MRSNYNHLSQLYIHIDVNMSMLQILMLTTTATNSDYCPTHFDMKV